MEIKVSSTLTHFVHSNASNSKLHLDLEVPLNEWILCIATLSENGIINIFDDMGGIRGRLFCKSICLSSGWSVFTDGFLSDKYAAPIRPNGWKNKYSFCLRNDCEDAIWFLLKFRHERDAWVESILKIISCAVSATPPSTPYSEYDNWPPICSKSIKNTSDLASPITFQPGSCSEPHDRARVYTVNPNKTRKLPFCCNTCCRTVQREPVSANDLKEEKESLHSFYNQEQRNGCCVDCCNLFCMSIMPGCTLLC